jgi:hypothetical protein
MSDENDRNTEAEYRGGHYQPHHAERFNQLPEAVKQWLENLREEDIQEFNDAVKLFRTVNSGGRMVKWTAYTIIAMFVGAAALGDALQKLWHWTLGK